jgi:hypothetical protein
MFRSKVREIGAIDRLLDPPENMTVRMLPTSHLLLSTAYEMTTETIRQHQRHISEVLGKLKNKKTTGIENQKSLHESAEKEGF